MARQLILWSLLGSCLWGQDLPRTAAHAVRGKIRIDGKLDEPDWADAEVITLTQQSPEPGKPSSYPTEARVLVAPEGLYFGIRCGDREPARIITHTLQRDGDFSSDDAVTLVLDTSGDHRTAYLFQVNAAGAQADGLISGPQLTSLDWDGIWEAATSRDSAGWTAEIFIPSRTLRFDPTHAQWGFNLERFVARDRTTLRWSAPLLDARLDDLARAGRLDGLDTLERGSGLSITPFLLAQRSTDFPSGVSHDQGRVGVDINVALTNQLGAVLTYRPDFAETEIDARQINLTRFPLYFPEKRAFFLEGANQFQYGLGLESEFIPFFSRTIGLAGGQVVPLDEGAKLLGRVGPLSVGALSIRQEASATGPAATLSTARVSWDVDDHLRLGVLATDGNPGGSGTNRFSGLDALWQTSTLFGDKLLEVGAWGGESHGTSLPGGDPGGWGLKADYPNDLWDLNARYSHFGDALDPAMGFLPRPGTNQESAGVAYQPRPSTPSLAWIRQAFFEIQATRVEDLQGRLESWQVFTAPFNIVTPAGDHFEADWQPEKEVLVQPFLISPGVTIPVGAYRFDRYRIQLESAQTRTWQAATTFWFGGFYGGSLLQWIPSTGWNAQDGHVRVTASAEQDFAHLPWGNFVQRLMQLKGEYAWSPALILSGLIEYDTESRNLGTNIRLRWRPRPEADVFLVWNRGWERPDLTGPLRFLPQDETISAKVRWTWRP
ncbi:MAG: carbohydrate binding family 9 domain-containing protein [Bacteroidetes bacterium]|nr:carbohydrate binding family 9 domain-containing protein [Bacteroidota bacterium]